MISAQRSPQPRSDGHRRRAERRRRPHGLALLLAVLCSGVPVACGGRGAAAPTPGGRATGVGPQTFGPGQFWYTRTISPMHQWFPAGGTIARHGRYHPIGPNVKFDLWVSEETWVGVDGTIRERMVVAGARFASAAGRASWEHTHPLVPHEPGYAAAYRRPLPNFNRVWLGWMSHDGITVGGDKFPPQPFYQGGEWLGPSGWDVGDSLFGYRELLSLPSGPAALRARLRRAEQALARRGGYRGEGSVRDVLGAARGAFGELSDIASLLTSPVPAAERLALFHAAITMPGARVNTRARDSLGLRGVSVSASAGLAFEQLIFDPTTGALLQSPNGVVVAQEIVESPYMLPKGVSPFHAPDAPPQSQTPAIAPAIGNPTSVFTLTLSPPGRRRPGRPPELDWVLIGTPTARCFAGFLPQPPPLVASASIRLAGRLTYVYRLGPTRVHRHTWCPGRYELTVLPDYSRRPLPPHLLMNLSPGLDSSIYFHVS